MASTFDEAQLLDAFATDDCKLFIRHWLALPRRDLVPHSRDFLDHPPVSHMSWVVIIDIAPDSLVCRFMGTEVVNSWQRDLSGQRVDQRAFSWGPKSGAGALQRMISQPCGLHRTVTVTLNSGRVAEYEAVQLPLAVDPGRPSRIVAYGKPIDPSSMHSEDHARVGASGAFRWFDIGAGVPRSPP